MVGLYTLSTQNVIVSDIISRVKRRVNFLNPDSL